MYKYSMWLFLAHPFLLKMLVTALGTLVSSTAVLFFLWAGVSRNALWGKRCVTSKKKNICEGVWQGYTVGVFWSALFSWKFVFPGRLCVMMLAHCMYSILCACLNNYSICQLVQITVMSYIKLLWLWLLLLLFYSFLYCFSFFVAVTFPHVGPVFFSIHCIENY